MNNHHHPTSSTPPPEASSPLHLRQRSDMGVVFGTIHRFHQHHERLKKFVHEGMRYPLPNWGRWAMGLVYFTIPVMGGYYVMQWAISRSHASIGEHGERLPIKEIQGLGDKRVGHDGQVRIIGAGGWGGGVHLAVSDEDTQKRNREKLNQFLSMQKIQLRDGRARSECGK